MKLNVASGIPHLPDGKIAAIDGLNVIATLIIACVYHYTHFWIANICDYPYYAVLGPLYNRGYLAVELFLLLSGLKIAHLYGKKIAKSEVSFFDFISKRILRLWPLLIATTVLTEILQVALNYFYGWTLLNTKASLFAVISNLLGLNSILDLNVATINGPAWTIPFEMAMYICFFIFTRLAKNRKMQIVASIVLLLAGLTIRQANMWYPIINGHLARALISFYIGVLLYEFQRAKIMKPVTVCMLCVMIWLISFVGYQLLGEELIGDIDGWMTLMIIPSIVMFSMNCSFVCKLLSNKVFVYLGKQSYSMYLIHFPVNVAMALVFTACGMQIPSGSTSFFWLRTILVLLATPLTYYCIELPANRVANKCVQNYYEKRGE